MTVTIHDSTRLFIQALFTRRFLSERVAQMLYRKCCDTVNSANLALGSRPMYSRTHTCMHFSQASYQKMSKLPMTPRTS